MSLQMVSCTLPSALRRISTTLLWLSPDTMTPFTYITHDKDQRLQQREDNKTLTMYAAVTSSRISPTLSRPSCSATPPEQISFTLSMLPFVPPNKAKPRPPPSGFINSTCIMQLWRDKGTDEKDTAYLEESSTEEMGPTEEARKRVCLFIPVYLQVCVVPWKYGLRTVTLSCMSTAL